MNDLMWFVSKAGAIIHIQSWKRSSILGLGQLCLGLQFEQVSTLKLSSDLVLMVRDSKKEAKAYKSTVGGKLNLKSGKFKKSKKKSKKKLKKKKVDDIDENSTKKKLNDMKSNDMKANEDIKGDNSVQCI